MKQKTGAGCDGFHRKVSFDLKNGNERRNRGILGEEWSGVAKMLKKM